jgi:glucose/arabinose dehydrogenase
VVRSSLLRGPLGHSRTLEAGVGGYHRSAGFQDSPVATGLQSPTALEFAPDDRLFVTEIGGTIRVIENGTLLEEPFVTIPGVDDPAGRGVQGLTFHPNFEEDTNEDYVYVHYTQDGESD